MINLTLITYSWTFLESASNERIESWNRVKFYLKTVSSLIKIRSFDPFFTRFQLFNSFITCRFQESSTVCDQCQIDHMKLSESQQKSNSPPFYGRINIIFWYESDKFQAKWKKLSKRAKNVRFSCIISFESEKAQKEPHFLTCFLVSKNKTCPESTISVKRKTKCLFSCGCSFFGDQNKCPLTLKGRKTCFLEGRFYSSFRG